MGRFFLVFPIAFFFFLGIGLLSVETVNANHSGNFALQCYLEAQDGNCENANVPTGCGPNNTGKDCCDANQAFYTLNGHPSMTATCANACFVGTSVKPRTGPVCTLPNVQGFCCQYSLPPPTPTPTPTPSCSGFLSCGTCQPSDSCGWCFSSSQCKHGSSFGSDDGLCAGSNWGFFSCNVPTPTPIPPTPTPTPTPTCPSFTDCATCVQQPNCGFGGVVVYSCRNGVSSSCPADYTLWNWSSCGASFPQNTCPVPTPTGGPTPTPTAGPTPTPTGGPTPTGAPTPTPTGGPTPTPTPTPFPTGIPCPNGTVGNTVYACLSTCPAGTTREPLACSPNPNGSLRVCCSVAAATPTPTPIPTAGPTPTPTGCGNYDTPLSGYLLCSGGGYICNHCGSCIQTSGNSCTAAGYVCVNRWIPQGGSPTTCHELDVSGKVSLQNGSPYTGGISTCSGSDAYGHLMCAFTGRSVITVQRAIIVCTGPLDPYIGSPNCSSSTIITPGATVGSTTNTQSGDYRYSPLTAGGYIVSITPPLGFVGISADIKSFKRSCFDPTGSARQCFTPTVPMSNPSDKVLSPTSAFISIPPGSPPTDTSWTTVDFVIGPGPTPTPIPTYSISGAIFTDTNGDLKKNPSEPNYLGPVNISITNGFASFAVGNSNGNYSSNNLPQGQYTVTFSGLPQGSVFTYPSSPLIVNVGPSCSVPITSEGTCSFGSIFSLNAGVTTSASAWFQSTGSDMRWDSGFSNTIPQNKYASILGTGGMPGIIFSGATTPSFGSGQASQNPFNWKVGSFADPEVFTDTHNLIPTSYRFLLETAQRSGITPTNIAALDSSLTHGVYQVNGDLNLNGSSYTFGQGNFIILINGNLNINEKILVPIGSTVIFSAKGNITVNKSIGEPASLTTPTIEGLYSADGNFIADGNKNCSLSSDLRLNIAGSVVANAGRGGGTFVNNRDMCVSNSSFPSVSFIERPDFILNYPSLVQSTTRAWQEVAP